LIKTYSPQQWRKRNLISNWNT